MEYIYSKINPDQLLHIINRKEDIVEKRNDLIPPDNYLQLSTFKLNNGKTFKAHKHIVQENNFNSRIPQESWTCLQGSFKAILYDFDDTIIAERILNSGDTSITLCGGHNYQCLEDNTIILEHKTGPYEGIEKDKEFI